MKVLVFLFGLIVGSFLNVCIYRIPREESIIFPPSHCTKCNKKLKWYDLIPLISFLILKGRCRYCKTKISLLYPLVELLNAIIFTLLYLKYGLTFEFIKFACLASLVIVIGFIDFFTTDIYTKTIVFGLIFGTIFLILNVYLKKPVYSYIMGAIFGGGVISLIILLTKGMGWGDAELFFIVGLFLGLKWTIVTLFLSFIIGGVVGGGLILFKIKSRKDYIPFGPFISFASIITIFFGDFFINKIWF